MIYLFVLFLVLVVLFLYFGRSLMIRANREGDGGIGTAILAELCYVGAALCVILTVLFFFLAVV